jgi:replicative DNA helicase
VPDAKTPPLADLEAEAVFLTTLAELGATDPALARQTLDRSLVVPERLFDPMHRLTLRAMTELLSRGKGTDTMSVALMFPPEQRPAIMEILGVDTRTCQVESLPHYAEKICRLALRRKVVALANEMRAGAHDLEADIGDVLSKNTKALSAITIGRRDRKTGLDAVEECFMDMQDIECGRGSVLIPTGLIALDNIIAGLAPTMHIVGARPGVGKSGLLAAIASSLAQRGIKIGVFSLEDSYKWIGWRVLASEARVPQMILKSKPLDTFQKRRVQDSVERIRGYAGNIVIESRTKNPRDICQSMRDMVLNDGVQVLAVDHLGELKYEGKSKERFDLLVGGAVQDMRDVANELQVPVILFSQIARRQGQKDGDPPNDTDFKNSGDIEAAARVLIGLGRKKGADEMTIRVLKNTGGLVGDAVVRFVGLAGMVRDCEGVKAEDLYSAQGEEEAAFESPPNWQDTDRGDS